MAETKAKTTKGTKTTKAKKEVEVAKEIETQTPELSAIMKMMEEMQAQMAEISNKNVELEKKNKELEQVKTETVKVTPDLNTIEPNEFINVMSLLDHTLNLSTQGYGKGQAYKFVGYKETQPIIYSDLSRIIANERRFLEKNYFVVLDDRVNKRHQLEKYSEIVTSEMIDSIVSLEPENVDELFALLSDEQKDNAVKMIVKNAIADGGESIKYGKIKKMSAHYKRNIQEMIDDSIDFDDLSKPDKK